MLAARRQRSKQNAPANSSKSTFLLLLANKGHFVAFICELPVVVATVPDALPSQKF